MNTFDTKQKVVEEIDYHLEEITCSHTLNQWQSKINQLGIRKKLGE